MKTPRQNAHACTRRSFLRLGAGAALLFVPANRKGALFAGSGEPATPVVSIAKVRNGDLPAAVEEAIDLLGGIQQVTAGKQRILLKPNLVAEGAAYTTKPAVIRTLARLMLDAGKEVLIGEGSAYATGVNLVNDRPYVTRCPDLLERLQQTVFDRLGYTALARSLGVPLLNLHLGDLVTVPVPQGLFWKEITLPRILTEVDLLCSVPMMKTHTSATVTLGLKNLIGCYPGACYGTFRYWVHDQCALKSSPGTAFEILDMARVNKLGLTVIDGSTAMQGDGPVGGSLLAMNLIVAGTSPLAADMVAARLMGFTNLDAIPQFGCAHKLGLRPATLEDIEVRGEKIAEVQRNFVRATPYPWVPYSPEIYPSPQPKLEVGPDQKAVITWDDAAPMPRPRIEYDADQKASLSWTNQSAGPRAYLERHSRLHPTGWRRVPLAAPGRAEFDMTQATNQFFRLRKLD